MWGYVVYGLWFLLWLVLELLGLKHKRGGIPWPTLSTVVRKLEARWPILRVVILAGLAVLTAHIVLPSGFP